MVSVQEATQIIHAAALNTGVESVSLHDAPGRVLAEPVVADRDFPPFNRVAMDGVAISSKTFTSGQKEFTIEAVHAAGSPAITLKNMLNCIEVMTGAILPEGADAVIRYEDLERNGNVAVIHLAEVRKGMNIHPQAQDAKQCDVLVQPGQVISSAEVALLAAVGKASVQVKAFPKTAIVSSGDELVEIDEVPERHQLRRSNIYALQAAMKQVGWQAELFHLADTTEKVEATLAGLLQQFTVLVLSGGVSKGKFDLIPDALSALGIEKRFHQVSQRPGKPFWFGSRSNENVVFALPGNPVSTYACFYRYILPWMMGQMGVKPKLKSAILCDDITFSPNLTYFLQVNTFMEAGRLMARPVPGGGSGDFVNLKEVDGFLELPAGKSVFKAGEAYPYIGFRHF
jgi:molybdopterin molybdotransferase